MCRSAPLRRRGAPAHLAQVPQASPPAKHLPRGRQLPGRRQPRWRLLWAHAGEEVCTDISPLAAGALTAAAQASSLSKESVQRDLELEQGSSAFSKPDLHFGALIPLVLCCETSFSHCSRYVQMLLKRA